MRRLLPLTLLLAGCFGRDIVVEPSEPVDCGAAALQSLVGQPLAMLPGTATHVRVLHPGDAATMDYSESRLNVTVDKADKITALTCG